VRGDLRAHHAGAEHGYLANDQIAHVVSPGNYADAAKLDGRFAMWLKVGRDGDTRGASFAV